MAISGQENNARLLGVFFFMLSLDACVVHLELHLQSRILLPQSQCSISLTGSPGIYVGCFGSQSFHGATKTKSVYEEDMTLVFFCMECFGKGLRLARVVSSTGSYL